MCHSGCYGPLPGSGHHSLPAPMDCSSSENYTPASGRTVSHLPRIAGRQEDEPFNSFSQGTSWVFPADGRTIPPATLSA